MPPAIQSRMQASAFGSGCLIALTALAAASRGAPLAIAASVAADIASMNSRRSRCSVSMAVILPIPDNKSLLHELELGQHDDAPQRICQSCGCQWFACQPD